MLHRLVALGLGLALGGVACGAAGAQTVHCHILPTADGFVALRAGPGAGTRMIARLRPGDEVMVINDQPAGRAWTEVRSWGRRVPYDRQPPYRQGFVAARFLADCDA